MTKRLIGELGLRFRPSAQADLEEHAAGLALLAADVADLPIHHLDHAIREHIRTSSFMPKAAELIALARKHLSAQAGTDHAMAQLQAHCDTLNLSERRMNSDRFWFVNGEAPRRHVDSRKIDPA